MTSKSVPVSELPEEGQDETQNSEDVANITLNHLQSTWDQVLRKVAEQSGLTLVMDVVPKGFFSRRDKRPHTLEETFQILNRDLEPKGFRLLQKDKFIVVLDLRSTKARYIRPTIQSAENESEQPQQKPSDVERVVHQETAPTSVQAARHADIAASVEPPAFENSARQLQPGTAEPAKVLFSVHPRTVHSTDILRLFYHAFETQAELQGEGPRGLPGIVVFESRQQTLNHDQDSKSLDVISAQVDFRIGLDKQNNELVFEASRKKAAALKSTVLKLDRSANGYAESIQLVTGSPQIGRVAQTLHQQTQVASTSAATRNRPANGYVDQLGSPREQRIDQLRERIDQMSFDEAQPQNPNAPQVPPQPAEKPENMAPKPSLPELLQDLSGNVNIESVPDLGVLILRGKDEDVNALMKIIKELEKLSEGTRPDIHLLNLRNVNSAALAELLNGVYEDLVKLRAIQGQEQKIKIIPLVKPNALLILAPETDMPSILKLADELDQPVDPMNEFGVFQLKSASASQVATTLREFYNERGGLGTRVVVSPNIRTNSIIVQAQPRDMQEVAALINKIDLDQSQAVSRVKIFPLKNAIAADLAETLNATLQSVLNPAAARTTTGLGANIGGPGGEAAQQLQEARSVVLEYLSKEGQQSRVLRSGLLADIRLIPDPRANTLVVTAPKDSLDLIGALIQQFDERVTTVAELKVFTLKNADAESMVTLLQSTFSEENQQTDLGIQIAGVNDANSNLIPLKFSVDRRTNSVVAQGGADALQIVEAILLKLDGADSRKRETTVIQLKNTPVADVSQAINEFLETQRSLIAQDPDLISSFELLEREVIVVPEPINNNLIISATPRYFEQVSNLVKELDKEAPQVIIQALIVEVELDNDDEFGVELGIQDSLLFNRSLIDNVLTVQQTVTGQNNVTQTNQTIVSQEATPGFIFNSVNPLGTNNTNNTGNAAGQALSNFSLQRGNSDLGFGGLVLSASSESVSILIRALAAKRNVHILSRPQIRTVDNVTAQIQVGQIVPVVNGVSVTAVGSANPVIVQSEAGIILTVTPRISPDGNIVMETLAEKSDFNGSSVPIFTDATTGNVVESPIKNITSVQTTVSVPNGQTVVLGGMITESDTTIERKVPWLGDIPVLGIPFRYDYLSTRRKELLVFLTPRIIRNDADSEFIKQVEAERIHLQVEKAEDMHGPIFAVPPGEPEFMPDGPGMLEEIPTTVMPQSNLNPMPETPPAPALGGEIQQMNYETKSKPAIPTKPAPKTRFKKPKFPYWKRD